VLLLRICKLDRVRQQVNQDLLQATLIRNTGSYIRREHEGQLQTAASALETGLDTPDKLLLPAPFPELILLYRLQF